MNKFQPSARLHNWVQFYGDSIDNSLMTWELTFHRFILAEFNTYRQGIARNTGSSRAIPTNKLIEIVQTANVQPVEWGKNQKGMSAEETISETDILDCIDTWENAKTYAIKQAKLLQGYNVHKQVINRLLEPFLPVTVIATMQYRTYQHIVAQRSGPEAQPEFRELVKAMEKEIPFSSAPLVNPEKYFYLPFERSYANVANNLEYIISDSIPHIARAARISYSRQNETFTPEQDTFLVKRLASQKHLSPFEHVVFHNDARFDVARKIFPLDFRNPISTFTNCFTFRNLIEAGIEIK